MAGKSRVWQVHLVYDGFYEHGGVKKHCQKNQWIYVICDTAKRAIEVATEMPEYPNAFVWAVNNHGKDGPVVVKEPVT